MKRFLTIVIILFIFQTKTAQCVEWVPFTTSIEGDVIFVDSESVTPYKNGLVSGWFKRNNKSPQEVAGSAVYSQVNKLIVNCNSLMFSSLQSIFYGKNQEFIYALSTPTDWLFAPPGSVVDDYIKLLCRTNR